VPVPVRVANINEALMPSLTQAWKTHRGSLPWVVLRKLFAKFVRTETLIVFSRDVRGNISPLISRDPSVLITCVAAPSAEIFQRLCARYPQKKFAERLRRGGQQCFIATRDGVIAGYSWVSTTELYVAEIERIYPVATDEVFIYDCFVEAAFRGAGIYPAMLQAAVNESRKRNDNLERAVIAASVLNHASIRGILKAGFAEEKRIRYVECLQKQKWWGFSPAGI
jgi:RimJ/RimL family protein N-acetyltransferase